MSIDDNIHDVSVALGVSEGVIKRSTGTEKQPVNHEDSTRFTNPKQIIFYGVPGCGKSHNISELIKDGKTFIITSEEDQIVRTVFHPDYTNADFIGQVLPEVNESKIEYIFPKKHPV